MTLLHLREKHWCLNISQVKLWLSQSQWEFSQGPGFQTIICLQDLAQYSIGFISWSDFISGEWGLFLGKHERLFHWMNAQDTQDNYCYYRRLLLLHWTLLWQVNILLQIYCATVLRNSSQLKLGGSANPCFSQKREWYLKQLQQLKPAKIHSSLLNRGLFLKHTFLDTLFSIQFGVLWTKLLL